MSIDRLKTTIKDCWAKTSAASEALVIVDFMAAQHPQALKMLTFQVLLHVTKREEIDEIFFTALNILISGEVNILEKKYLLSIDEEEFPITREEFSYARSHNSLFHPETGIEIKEFEKHIILYFSASENFLKAMNHE